VTLFSPVLVMPGFKELTGLATVIIALSYASYRFLAYS